MLKTKKINALKLGPKAASFYDPVNKLTIAPKQIVIRPKKHSNVLKQALKGGHVVTATESEYNKYVKKMEKAGKAVKDPNKDSMSEDELYPKTREEILEHFGTFFEKEDLDVAKAIEDKNEMLVYLRKQEEEEYS